VKIFNDLNNKFQVGKVLVDPFDKTVKYSIFTNYGF